MRGFERTGRIRKYHGPKESGFYREQSSDLMEELNQGYYDSYISTARQIYQNLVVRDEEAALLSVKHSKHRELGQSLVSSIMQQNYLQTT